MFKSLKIPIKIINRKSYDLIAIKGINNFTGFTYHVPGDISSSAFYSFNIANNNSEIIIKNVNINDTRTGIIKILNKMNANILFKNKRIYKGETIADINVKVKK